MRIRDRIRLAGERYRDEHAFKRQASQPATWRWYSTNGFLHPGEHHGHLATTAHKQAIYPFVSQSGLGNRGVLIGRNAHGGPFALDPWELYAAEQLHDPNMIVLGLKGFGKSTLCKTYCYRQNAIGRRVEVIDRKSEYGPLIAAMGGATVRLEPGVCINPLERIGSDASRQSLLRAVTRTLLDRDLKPDEKVGLAAALVAVDARGADNVLIPDIVEELRDPCLEVARELNLDRPVPRTPGESEEEHAGRVAVQHRQARNRAADELRECMLVLRDLSIGPLQGMFDQPTTAGNEVWDRDAVSIDISGIAEHTYGADENTALAIAMVSATAFLDGRRRARERTGQRKRTIRVNDEAWRALSVPGATEYYTAALKLSRQTGMQHVVILHKLTDLSAVGDTGTRTQKLAEGIAAECAIRVIYCQPEQEADLVARSLQLNSTERELVTMLGQGDALWRLEQRGFRVRHEIARAEWDLVATDQAMGLRTPRAVGGP